MQVNHLVRYSDRHRRLRLTSATLLLLLSLLLPTAAKAITTADLTLVTDVSTLTNTDKVVIALADFSKGVTGYKSNDATVSATIADWKQYEVVPVTDGVNLKDGEKYIANPGSNNKFSYGIAGVFTVTDSGCLTCSYNNVNKILCRQISGTTNYYRFYSSTSINNNYTPFYVYKVNGGNPLSISIAANGETRITVEKDTEVILTCTAVNASEGIMYQWYSNTEASNENGTTITGAESATYTVPTSVPGTYYFYCYALDNDEAYSNVVTVVVEDPNAPKPETVSITKDDFNGTSYAANNDTHTKKSSMNNDFKYVSTDIMLSSGAMQWKKTSGCLYNSKETDLGEIDRIEITVEGDNNLIVKQGKSEQPASGLSLKATGTNPYVYKFQDGFNFFYIKNGDATTKTSEVKIYYKVKEIVAVSGVTLDKISATLTVGETLDLTATVAPEDATNKGVTWTSSDDTIATVVDGHVTAIKDGTATITVKADGGFTATCTVTIKPLPTCEITWSVNGTPTTTTQNQKSVINFPKKPSVDGYVFRGWTTSATVSSDGNGIAYLDGNATVPEVGSITYYAVFAILIDSRNEDITLNYSNFDTSYSENERNVSNNSSIRYVNCMAGQHTGDSYTSMIQMKKTPAGMIYNIDSMGIVNIDITYTDLNKVSAPTNFAAVYFGDEEKINAEANLVTGTRIDNTFTYTNSNNAQYFNIVNGGGTVYIDQIVIHALESSYSDYTTRILEDPELAFVTDYELFVDEEDTVSCSSGANSTGVITYSTKNTDVISLNAATGHIIALAPGTATVTATIANTDVYASATATCEVTVIPNYVSVTTKATSDGNCWATFASAYNVLLPEDEDVTVYFVDDSKGVNERGNVQIVSLEEFVDEDYPLGAGVGVLVKSATAKTVEFECVKSNENAWTNTQLGNALVGVLETTSCAAAQEEGYTNFLFADKDHGVGFYRWTSDGAGAGLAAGKCYLKLQTGSNANAAQMFISLPGDDTVTNVEDLFNADDDDAPIYTPMGVRVSKEYKGIVIKNGKKYVNK